METWTLIISAAALAVSLYTYFAHDRRLKQQERLINSYQLKQLQEEEQANKKANIRAEISQNTKGPRTLRIWNNGRAVARNIRVEGLDVKGLIVMNDEIFPYEIMNPQDDAELYGEDGYVHLELRYNDYDDVTGYGNWGAVSYNLNSLNFTDATKGIKLKLNSSVNGEIEVAFDFVTSDDEGEGSSEKGLQRNVDLSKVQLK